MKTRSIKIAFWLAVLVIAACYMITRAPARERFPGQYAQVDPAIGKWFQDQRVPGRNYSCCSMADGTRADEKREDGKLFTQFTYTAYVDGVPVERRSEWMEVPDDTIIRGGENPMGAPVVWYYTEGLGGEIVKIRCYKPATDA